MGQHRAERDVLQGRLDRGRRGLRGSGCPVGGPHASPDRLPGEVLARGPRASPKRHTALTGRPRNRPRFRARKHRRIEREGTNPLPLAGRRLALATPAAARDQIRIVGSSTVFPFSTAVAESFGRAGGFKTPVVESTGTGGGIQLFCSGAGLDTPDIANASRRIKPAEVEMCAKNGVKDIVEVKIGYDGIVLANSKKHARLEPHQGADLPGAREAGADRRQARAEPVQAVERHRSLAAEAQDRGARAAADVGHPRRLRRARDGGWRRGVPDAEGAQGQGREGLQGGRPRHPRGRRLRRGGRERQSDRPEAGGESQRARRVRVLLPRPEHGQASRAAWSRASSRPSRTSRAASTASRGRSTST